jgi:sugar/nucleoside kinase (ribokinase family)
MKTRIAEQTSRANRGGVKAGAPQNSSHNNHAAVELPPEWNGTSMPPAWEEHQRRANRPLATTNEYDQATKTNACPDCDCRTEDKDKSPAATLVEDSCDAVYVANAPLDFIALRVASVLGHNHPCHVEVRPSGPAVNGGQVLVANGYQCAVVCLQGQEWAEICRHKFNALGLQSFIIERNGHSGAVTLGVPNGHHGTFDLYTQRMSPNFRLSELTEPLLRRIRSASTVLVAPMPAPDEESLQVLRLFAAYAQYSVLQPHPDLVGHEAFSDVASHFDLVVMNAGTAELRDPAINDLAVLALRLGHDLGERTSFIVTNGPGQGLAWIEGHWWSFDPPTSSRVVIQTGAGDVFTGSFITEYRLKGRSPRAALDTAAETASRWACGQPVVVTPSNIGQVSGSAVSQRQFALWD